MNNVTTLVRVLRIAGTILLAIAQVLFLIFS